MKINNLTGKPNAGAYKGRCTGKSTALAFKYISEALANPNKRISVRDHYDTWESNARLARYVRYVVDASGLKEMEFYPNDLSICFNLYSNSDEYIELDGQVYKKIEDM